MAREGSFWALAGTGSGTVETQSRDPDACTPRRPPRHGLRHGDAACSAAPVQAPTQQTPPDASAGLWQYTAETTTLNDCHATLPAVYQFTETHLGTLAWTKTGATQELNGTIDALLTGQWDEGNGCLLWLGLLVHAPSGTATMSGGARCPDGMRSCGFQTSGQVVRLR